MLQYIVRLPKAQVDNPVLLLLLHGYGSNEQDLFEFAPDLPDDLLIISARAPIKLDYGGYAWYTINFSADQNRFSDITEGITARELLADFIDNLQQTYHFDTDKSMIMGFSQGAILSYALALTYPKKIKNILAISGYINKDLVLLSDNLSSLKKLNFFCSHGTLDPVIPVDWARNSATYLQANHLNFQCKEYNAGHTVSYQNFLDIKHWIEKKCDLL